MKRAIGVILIVVLWHTHSAGAQVFRDWNDADGDALVRRTDIGNDGTIRADVTLPDLILMRIGAWQTASVDAGLDPYEGTWVESRDAHIVRIDLVFKGLINPPGPIGLTGVAPVPFTFGPSPVFGFIEFDIDRDRNTGGQSNATARSRFLANVARFGARPSNDLAPRIAVTGADLDNNCATGPQFERSGEEFTLNLCGCYPVTIESETPGANAALDHAFGPGETWIVRSRFFQRAEVYTPLSSVVGGSGIGAYDPLVDLRFAHDIPTDLTTVSLVYPLDALGAATLRGETSESFDDSLDNHHSIAEALNDIINGVNLSPIPTEGPCENVDRWRNAQVGPSMLDPTRWRATALIGTTYRNPEESIYIWTDVGFNVTRGDVNGDGAADLADRAIINDLITELDGGPLDPDGQNRRLTIPGFADNFSLYDINYDGYIGDADLALIPLTPVCAADYDDNGTVDIIDVLSFLSDWFDLRADFNQSGTTDVLDLLEFLSIWFAGCD